MLQAKTSKKKKNIFSQTATQPPHTPDNRDYLNLTTLFISDKSSLAATRKSTRELFFSPFESARGGSCMGEGGTGGNESQTPERDEVDDEAADALIPDELPVEVL